MKQLNSQQIQHINVLLSKIKDIKGEYFIENKIDYDLLISELLVCNKQWNYDSLFESISILKNYDDELTYENVNKLTEKIDKIFSSNHQTVYYIPVDYYLEDEFMLNSIKIRKVKDIEEHKKIVQGIINLKNNPDFLYYKWGELNIESLNQSDYYFLEFTVNGNGINECNSRFHSTFLLFRGIIEFYYSYDMWSIKGGNHKLNNNPIVVHPPFYFSQVGKDYFDIQFFHNRQTKNIVSFLLGEKETESIKNTFKTFEDEIIDNTTKGVLSSCFRLFGLSMDSKTWEQSFLYLWNILDEITLSQSFRGNTQQILEKCRPFYPPDWGKYYYTKIRSLSEIRNNLVHKGISNISDVEVGILKMICVTSIRKILKYIDNMKTIEQLKLFYDLRDVKTDVLENQKEFIEFVIKQRNENPYF